MRLHQAGSWLLLFTAFSAWVLAPFILYPGSEQSQTIVTYIAAVLLLLFATSLQLILTPVLGKATSAAAVSLGMGLLMAFLAATAQVCPGATYPHLTPCTSADVASFGVSMIMLWLLFSAFILTTLWLAGKTWAIGAWLRRHLLHESDH